MQFFEGLLTLESLLTFFMLVMLQAVLGFDNLLYISIESKRVEADKQSMVRTWGVGLAIGLRLILLFVMMLAIGYLKEPFWGLHLGAKDEHGVGGLFNMDLTVHALVVLIGGVFIMYTAVKEIYHMLSVDDLGHGKSDKPKSSVGKAITWIVLMNLVFSFDSILSAIALTHNFIVMAAAVLVSGALMIWLADRVAVFLEKNRMYEVLGLFILLIVGVMLLAEGGHLSHMAFFGHHINQMSSVTFYFVIAVLVLVDVVQGRYQKKLLAQRAAVKDHAGEPE